MSLNKGRPEEGFYSGTLALAKERPLRDAQRPSSFFEFQSCQSKGGSDQLGLLAQASDCEVELLVQLFQVQAYQVPHFHVLQ